MGETRVNCLKGGYFHQGVLLGGVSLRGVFPHDMSFGIPRVLVPYK